MCLYKPKLGKTFVIIIFFKKLVYMEVAEKGNLYEEALAK